jgi:hypothetical protein
VVWLVSLQLGGVKHSSTFQLIATILKVVLIVAFLGRDLSSAANGHVHPSVSDFAHIASAPRSRSAWRSHVFFSGWTPHLHHRRDARPRAEPAARDAGGDVDRAVLASR